MIENDPDYPCNPRQFPPYVQNTDKKEQVKEKETVPIPPVSNPVAYKIDEAANFWW